MNSDGKFLSFTPECLEQPSLPLPFVVARDEHIVLSQFFVVYHHLFGAYARCLFVTREGRTGNVTVHLSAESF